MVGMAATAGQGPLCLTTADGPCVITCDISGQGKTGTTREETYIGAVSPTGKREETYIGAVSPTGKQEYIMRGDLYRGGLTNRKTGIYHERRLI